MRKPRHKLLALAAAVGAVLTLLTPTAAHAAYYGTETDYAEAAWDPAEEGHWYACVEMTGAKICFMPYGDKIFVKDTKADGRAAVAEWLYQDDDGYRTGSCVNKHQAGSWGLCNKNFKENWLIKLGPALYNNGNPVYRDDAFPLNCDT